MPCPEYTQHAPYYRRSATVRDKQYLKEIRITHVLNCAEGRRAGHLNVSGWYYQDADIKYMGLPLEDMPSANIEDYFQCASHFIDCALYNGGACAGQPVLLSVRTDL